MNLFDYNNRLTDDQKPFFRGVLFVIAVTFPLLGLLIYWFDKSIYDPLLYRTAIGFIALSIYAGTYSNAFSRYFHLIFNILLLLIVLWTGYLALINDFSFGNTILYITAATVVMFSMRNWQEVIIISVPVFVSVAIFLNYTELSFFSKLIVFACIFFIGLGAFLTVRVKNIFVRTIIDREAKYKLLAENIKDVIWLYNVTRQQYVYISPSVYELTGFTVNQAEKQSFKESYQYQSAQKITNEIKTSVEKLKNNPSDNYFHYHVVKQLCANGNYIWVEVGTSLRVNKNHEIEILGVSRNINERKQTEMLLQDYSQELFKLNAEKDRIISVLAHDLKNPFNTLMGYTEIILRNINKYSKDELALRLKIVNKTATKTYFLLEQILLWANSQSGKLSFNIQRVVFFETIKDTVELIELQAQSKNVKINLLTKKSFEVFADSQMLNIVIRNLLTNALKYSYNNGSINIYGRVDQNQAVISVEDFGVGINKEDISDIFIFGKAKSNKGTKGEEGTGFGLPLCKELVERHGGKIWVESNIGKSTVFHFTLPAN